MARNLVYTLDARGNVMLEVKRDHFSIHPERMQLEIQGMLAKTERILAS